MSRSAKEPELVLFCRHCGQGMPVPDEIRLLAEAMAAEIVFGVANGTVLPSELGRAGAHQPDPHVVRTRKPVLPSPDDGR